MKNLYEEFLLKGEYFAAGLFYDQGASRMLRYAKAYELYFANIKMAEYREGVLYPGGHRVTEQLGVYPNFSYSFDVMYDLLEQKGITNADEIKKEHGVLTLLSGPHTVGGNIYTHSIPNYGRIIKEGDRKSVV